MKKKNIYQYLIEPFSTRLDQWECIDIFGEDREKFFQGQITQDIYSIDIQTGKLASRLNRQGQVVFYFFVIRYIDQLKIIIPNAQTGEFKKDIEKFIVMDDVVIVDNSKKYFLNFNSQERKQNDASILYYGLNAIFSDQATYELVDLEDLELFRKISFFPKENSADCIGQILNETILNEYAVSYQKGCFLGQETVAKIENNRGASFYPVFLKVKQTIKVKYLNRIYSVEGKKGGLIIADFLWNDENYLQATLFRDFRVQGKKLIITIDDECFDAEVCHAPFLINKELFKDLSQYLFLKHSEVAALNVLKSASQKYSGDPDVLEMLGALHGRLGNFKEAIDVFEQLERADSTSVMAHTNKSLYYMKLGMIELAEEEKSKAIVKSFEKNADETKRKKIKSEEAERKKLEIKKRESMFLRVLEIDPEDTVAHQGLGDVYFQAGQFEKSLYHLEMALTKDQKLSVSYLLSGKCFEALGKINEAKKIYEYGIAIASKQGDMMPANEMQSRLNLL